MSYPIGKPLSVTVMDSALATVALPVAPGIIMFVFAALWGAAISRRMRLSTT